MNKDWGVKMELKMTLKEADRLTAMKLVKSKKISIKEASIEIGLCYKQTCRLYKRYKKEGPKGLISKKRGQPSNHRLADVLIEKALSLIKERYVDYGPTLISEKLQEKHALQISRETIRQLMIKEEIWRPRKQRNKKIYSRRTRRSRLGELEQIDGSYEHWFEDRAEKCCLLVCVDDATSSLMHLQFCKHETTEDYLQFLKNYLKKHGKPLAFYSDKHSIFRVNNKKRYEGTVSTKFQKVLKKLEIELICANSPQAKGRVERANGILQDRLIKELRERNISSIEEANFFLEEFRLLYNKKFAVEPASLENAHRTLSTDQDFQQACLFEEERVLSKDLSFQYKNEIYQIDSEYRHRLYGKRIKIYELEGKIQKIEQNGKELKFYKWKEKICQPTKVVDVKELQALWPTVNRKPKKYHPWKQGNFLKKIAASYP